MLPLFSSLLALAVTSGLNLYATVLATGLAIRLGWVTPPDALSGLNVLSDTTVLIVAGVLFAVEFVADKIPVVEHAWDLLHTIVRPVGAVWIGLKATSGLQMNPASEMILLLLMGGAALTSHLGKAGTRLASASTGGHLIGIGLVLSLLEDLFTVAVAPLALNHPAIVVLAAAGVLGAIAVVVPRGFRYVRSLVRRCTQ
jgi:hypothetical protein